MKVVDRKTFLALPAGTLFHRWPEQGDTLSGLDFEQLFIKGETLPTQWPGDFYYQAIPELLVQGEDWITDVYQAFDNGREVPVQDIESRDGGFNELARYAVWSADDVIALQRRIAEALRTAYPTVGF